MTLALALSLGFTTAAHADHYEEFAQPGPYLGIGVRGGAYTQLDQELEDSLVGNPDVETETALGFEVYGGFRVHPHFAVEAEFEMFPEAEVDVRDFGSIAELESWTLTGNLKAFPLTGRVQPYALLGMGGMYAELEDTLGLSAREDDFEFAVRLGGGLEVYLNENFAVTAGVDYIIPTGDLDDLDLVTFGAGVKFKFGVGY